MKPSLVAVSLVLLATALARLAPAVVADAAVEVSEGFLDLPSDEEGPADVNPPFDLFQSGRFNYPYTLRETLTGKQSTVRYRALILENEHLRLVVLPELGGHVYTCVDKANGAEMFYANRSIRKARIGYRGAWAAYGVEFNFPVSHNWMSMSPVDYATVANPDGSASIWVGNVDRPYGMQWRVELKLRPGRSVLEQNVALHNRSSLRHRFYWWNNAAVRVHDDSRIHYPMRWTASHGFREVDTWPVDSSGLDLSLVGNHRNGPVSLFSHGSREAFMGVYHPWSQAGVVHYSSPEDAPTKKIWSFGGDADGIDWRRALSDDQSAYVEVQAGLFRNQETYGFLEPQQTIRFREYWLPVRGIGGITRANPEAVVRLERNAEKAGTVALSFGANLTRTVRGGALRLKDGDRIVYGEALNADPAQTVRGVRNGLPARPRYTLELADADGRVLIAHTEDVWDYAPESEIRLGQQPSFRAPPAESRSDGDFLQIGDGQERDGKLLVAHATYLDGLKRFPESFGLLKAAGRLEVALQRSAEARPRLARAQARVTNDPEVRYYLGLALSAEDQDAKARAEWEGASILASFRPAARLELARLDAREGDLAGALERVRAVIQESTDAVRAGGLEVALLRRLGLPDEARRGLAHWRELDPTGNLLRAEAAQLGPDDPALWTHLAGDPERVLDVVDDYLGLGFFEDAIALLERHYPTGAGVEAEAGTAAPQDYPLVAYYRGYCRERKGGSGAKDYAIGSEQSTRYVFPNRASTEPVLRAALRANPRDPTAHFLLGSLLLSGGRSEDAISEWRETRRLDPKRLVLHRNLGLTLLHARGDAAGALGMFREGLEVDRDNMALYVGADQTLSLLGRPAADHIALIERHPDRAALPPVLVEKLALALADADRAAEAETLFANRFFAREENGTNVRQVFLEVRLRRALALARAGKGREALEIVRSLDRPLPQMSFTRDGLEAFVDGARVQYVIGEILSAAGRGDEAREHWERATKGQDWPYLKPVFAYLAARRLGTGDDAAQKRELEASLARSEEFLARGTAFPGLATYAQGLHLRALGREAEAQARFRQVFLLPDLRLSHFLARRALEARDPL
jgi:tetratricopeptide (TPR) repeat protein